MRLNVTCILLPSKAENHPADINKLSIFAALKIQLVK